MNTNEQKARKGFPTKEVVIVAVTVVVLVAILIPVFVSFVNRTNEYEDKLNQQLAELQAKVENQDCLTLEDLDAALSEKLAGLTPSGDTLSKEDIEKAVVDAVTKYVAEQPSQTPGLTAADVQKIVNDAIKTIPTNTGVTKAQMQEAINKALADVLTEAEIKAIIDAAIDKALAG